MYKSALCHLHSFFHGASIAGYCHEARARDIDIVWISDHDRRFLRVDRYRVDLKDRYDFETIGSPFYSAVKRTDDQKPGIRVETSSWEKEWQGAALHLSCLAETENLKDRPDYRSRPTMRLDIPLISRPRLKMKLKTDLTPEDDMGRLLLRLHLNQLPPDHEVMVFDYCFGAVSGDENMIMLSEGESVEIDLLEDLKRTGLNEDHALRQIELRIETREGRSAFAELLDLSIETEIADKDELLAAQKRLAQKLEAQYGINVLINYEVSAEEQDMTGYGEGIPIPNSTEKVLNCREVNSYMEKQGGLACYNHPFSDWRWEELSKQQKEAVVIEHARELLRCDLYGARLLEVGFPEGRHGFSPEHYLKLWDLLNLEGLKVVGIGASDSHSNQSWHEGNNFANYFYSSDCSSKNLVSALASGDIYMADPVRVQGPLSFVTDTGMRMGEVFKGEHRVMFKVKGIPHGSEQRWIVDGITVQNELTADTHESEFCLKGIEHFIRVELWDPYGRPILLTNPLWAY